MIDLKKVGAHYAVSSLFEDYIDETDIYSYAVTKEDYTKTPAGATTTRDREGNGFIPDNVGIRTDQLLCAALRRPCIERRSPHLSGR